MRDQFRAAANRPRQCRVRPLTRVIGAELTDQAITLLPVPRGPLTEPGGLPVMLPGLLRADVHGQMSPRAKLASSDGTAESNPATSSVPGSSGSAMVKSVAVIPVTDMRAGMPVFSRYSRRAWCGWM